MVAQNRQARNLRVAFRFAMPTVSFLVVMTTLLAADPVGVPPAEVMSADPEESGPNDQTLTTPTALISSHVLRFELREGLLAGGSLGLANRLQVTAGALLPVSPQTRIYFGQLKVRLFTVQRFTFSVAVAKVRFRLTASNETDFVGGALLGTYCLTSDCRSLASGGIWYGNKSTVVDTSPSSYDGWTGTANVIVAVGPHSSLLAETWFGGDAALFGGGVRLFGRALFADLGFVVYARESVGLPWVNLGWGIGIKRLTRHFQ